MNMHFYQGLTLHNVIKEGYTRADVMAHEMLFPCTKMLSPSTGLNSEL